MTFENFISKEVFGLPPSLISEVGERIELYKAGLAPAKQPLGAFLLTGDPGTGKTLFANKVAEFIHGIEGKVLHIAGEDFTLPHEVAKLKGSPPGYLGHKETPPLLGQKALANVTSKSSNLKVVLVDEIDKTPYDFSKVFLGIIESGFCTMGDNSISEFMGSLIFFTANWGSEKKARSERWGFVNRIDETATTADIRNGVTPALLDRIKAMGGIHEFPAMTPEVRENIVAKRVEEMENFLSERRQMRVSLRLHPIVAKELCGEAKEKRSGRVVAQRTKDYILKSFLANREVLERLTGSERDKTKVYTLELNPGYEMKQIVKRSPKEMVMAEGV